MYKIRAHLCTLTRHPYSYNYYTYLLTSAELKNRRCGEAAARAQDVCCVCSGCRSTPDLYGWFDFWSVESERAFSVSLRAPCALQPRVCHPREGGAGICS